MLIRKFVNLPHRHRTGITGIVLIALLAFGLVGVNLWSSVHRASAASNAQVTVNANQYLGTLTNGSRGVNTAVWDSHLLDGTSASYIKSAGITALRYPGGSSADLYHWKDNSGGGNNNFDAFISMAQSVSAQPIITINYGSGSTQEAADWVRYSNKGGNGYNGPVPSYGGASRSGHNYGVKYWEIGNELYGDGTYGNGWENNPNNAHTPAAYASGINNYSRAMKAVDSSISIGAVLTTPNNWPDGFTNSSSPQPWNITVLSSACSSIDFVILHWYPQGPGGESDANLLSTPAQIPGMISKTRSEINQYCGSHASAVKIMVTETNSVSSNPGKQIVSVVNALFLADDYSTMLEQSDVTNVDWWDLHNGAVAGNMSSSLYGSYQFGDYGILANGGCTNGCEPAVNTPLPSYYGFQMLNYMGRQGDSMVSSSSNQNLVAAHAVKQSNGKLAVLLINKDPYNSYNVSLNLNGYSAGSSATIYTYGKSSNSISSTNGSPTGITVAPYSLNLMILGGNSTGGTGGSTPTPVPNPGGGSSFTPVSGANYLIINRRSGQALEILGWSRANGGTADQWTNGKGANQEWNFVPTNGGYKLVNINSKLVLDDPGGSSATGTQLDQWNDTNGSNQAWNIVSTGDGYYSLINQSSGLYADITGGSLSNGANLILWPGPGGQNQQWSFVQA